MASIINIIKIATHIDHIKHPFNIDAGLSASSLTQRISGIVAFIFVSLLTLGIATGFYLYQAKWKWENQQVQTPTELIPKENVPVAQDNESDNLRPSKFGPIGPNLLAGLEDVGSISFFDNEKKNRFTARIIHTIKGLEDEYQAFYSLEDKIYCMGMLRVKQISETLQGKSMFTLNDIEIKDPVYFTNESTQALRSILFITDLGSFATSRFKGVGSGLMKFAVELSHRRRCEGRILLDASLSSHGFYITIGMKSIVSKKVEQRKLSPGEVDEWIRQKTRARSDTQGLGQVLMYMPLSTIEKFCTKADALSHQ